MKKQRSKGFYTWGNIIPKIAFTLYLAMYSSRYMDISMLKPWIDINNNTLRIMVIFIAYILSNFITTKNVKYHKTIKWTYFINAIIFLFIISI